MLRRFMMTSLPAKTVPCSCCHDGKYSDASFSGTAGAEFDDECNRVNLYNVTVLILVSVLSFPVLSWVTGELTDNNTLLTAVCSAAFLS